MRIRLTLALILLFLTLIGVVTTAARASAALIVPDDPELGILFDGGDGLFWVRPDGSDLTQVWDFSDPRLPEGRLSSAALSPDGSKVIFVTYDSDILFWLWLLDLETGNISQLAEGQSWIVDPHWSPNGSKVSYAFSGTGSGINIIDINTASQWLLVATTWIYLTEYRGMNWSLDSRQLAFSYERNGSPGIFTVNVDGSDLRFVTPPSEPASAPAWDASGSILYYVCRGNGGVLTAICLMDIGHSLSFRLADMADVIPPGEYIESISVSLEENIVFTHTVNYLESGSYITVFWPESGEVHTFSESGESYWQPQWSYRPNIP